jgi:ADP-ribose diphosphatase
MSDDLRWKLGARHPGHDYKIFKTSFVDGSHERTGKALRFSIIESTNWVNVIALTRADRVVLVRQYRPGVDRVCVEIPGGMVDPGEEPLAAAQRELVEETGYTSASWRMLGKAAPNPAIQINTLYSFLALDAEPTQVAAFDGNEVMATETAALADVKRMLRDGTIDHALVITAFAHLAFGAGDLRRP